MKNHVTKAMNVLISYHFRFQTKAPRLFLTHVLFFSILLINGGFGSWNGFLGLGCSIDGVWGLRCRAFWVLWGWGSRYKHKRITLGKNGACQPYAFIILSNFHHSHENPHNESNNNTLYIYECVLRKSKWGGVQAH